MLPTIYLVVGAAFLILFVIEYVVTDRWAWFHGIIGVIFVIASFVWRGRQRPAAAAQ
jgi:Flp pilus assembly protein TadB